MFKPALLLAVALPLVAAPLTQADRDKLIQDLEHSRQVFLTAIADVKTEAQWNYKPAPDRWSVGECAAHIIAAEAYFRENISETMKSPPLPPQQQSDAGDAIVSSMVRNRTAKFQAPAAIEPTGKVRPKSESIAAFEATRAKTLDYVRTTQDALREHGSGTPPQVMSAYQQVLMLSGHTERHTAQLLEVKATAGYPKN
jgi:hypothetical protein